MEKEEVVLDLETMGNGNNAAIVAIGACKFAPHSTVGPSDTFYREVDLESSVDAGMKIDASTILWWMQQSDEARKSTFTGDRVPLGDALYQFSKWFGEDRPVWGNGATFDNVIVRSGFAAVRLPVPWKFWNDRCYRTMKNLRPDVKMERVGVAHNALSDAISQALHLQKIYSALGLSTTSDKE